MTGLRRHWQTWREVWRQRDKLDRPVRRGRQEREFLPAALEIQETPPAPLGRSILWVILVVFTSAVLWACLGKIDVVATAQGKIVPSGEVKTIQPLEVGRVAAINVSEGQFVRAGDVLVELDSVLTRADESRLERELQRAIALRIRLTAQLQAVESAGTSPPASLEFPESVHVSIANQQRAQFGATVAEYQSQLATLNHKLDRRRAERSAARETIRELENTLPLITRRVAAMKSLVADAFAAESTYLELEEQRIAQAHRLSAERERAGSLTAGINEVKGEIATLREGFRRQTLAGLDEAEREVSRLEQDLIKARERTDWQTLRAPVDGVVQQMEVHTLGGVVQAAQPLMVVVPTREELEVRAWVTNKDIGFVWEGQDAVIKIKTFPFTKYGSIDGHLINVSTDAVEDENLGLVYAARILMERSTIQAGKRMVNLTPGMAVTVELKTGTRRIIEYFLSPLLRRASESIRER